MISKMNDLAKIAKNGEFKHLYLLDGLQNIDAKVEHQHHKYNG